MKVFSKYLLSLIILTNIGFFASCSKDAVEELEVVEEISLLGEWQFETNDQNLISLELTQDERVILNYKPVAISFDINNSSSVSGKVDESVKYLSFISNYNLNSSSLNIEDYKDMDYVIESENRLILYTVNNYGEEISYTLNRRGSKYSSNSTLFDTTVWKITEANGVKTEQDQFMGWTLSGHFYYFAGQQSGNVAPSSLNSLFVGGDFNLSSNSKSDINFNLNGNNLYVKSFTGKVVVNDEQGNTLTLEPYTGDIK